jgi:hypothetical protein
MDMDEASNQPKSPTNQPPLNIKSKSFSSLFPLPLFLPRNEKQTKYKRREGQGWMIQPAGVHTFPPFILILEESQ